MILIAHFAAVYHLSAQFPGPTTPRDFVTLLLTSSNALKSSASSGPSPSEISNGSHHCDLTQEPRHFMVVSKPCIHPDCPPREGFIRGEYESVEFIREIPLKPRKSASTLDLSKAGRRPESRTINKEAMIRSAQQKSHTFPLQPDGEIRPPSSEVEEEKHSEVRRRGKTISFAESRGQTAKGEQMDTHQGGEDDEIETNPVEWIMITRSDPGGSVPRWMVERGTPSGIVADAGKFLNWACVKDHTESEGQDGVEGKTEVHIPLEPETLNEYQANGHLAGVSENDSNADLPKEGQTPTVSSENSDERPRSGIMQSLASAAYAGIETYAPQTVVNHLPGHIEPAKPQSPDKNGEPISNGTKDNDDLSSVSDTSSIASFASADSHFGDEDGEAKSLSSKTTSSNSKEALTGQEKELAKLNERKKKLDERLAKTREKETKDREELTSKEQANIKKAEEKHAKEVAKQEEKYKKEMAKLEAKRNKEAAKIIERKKKADDKDEKAKLQREKDEVKAELDVVKKERDILKTQVGELQRENTALASRLGKIENGNGILKEVRAEILGGGKGRRSRSNSVESRGLGKSGSARSRQSTLLGKDYPSSVTG